MVQAYQESFVFNPRSSCFVHERPLTIPKEREGHILQIGR